MIRLCSLLNSQTHILLLRKRCPLQYHRKQTFHKNIIYLTPASTGVVVCWLIVSMKVILVWKYETPYGMHCKSYDVLSSLTLYIPGYFYTLFVPGGGGKFAPLSKDRLVSDRIEIFCLLMLFFVKFLKINFLSL